ncbi:MAG: hypothetical protein MMC23_000770 [Stictis urceolatum]|nr:hypothetical protein [Stictis urceolata]
MPEYQTARNISIFLSMPAGEVSTGPIVRDALKCGKRVFVPFTYKSRSTGRSSLMDMVALHGEEDYDALKPDKWGIPTPNEASVENRARCLCKDFGKAKIDQNNTDQEALSERLDMIVMPGVAFDQKKQRLGHGMGYYDVFLSRYNQVLESSGSGELKMPFLVGIALREQMLASGEQVPIDSSDWLLDAIIAGDLSIS